MLLPSGPRKPSAAAARCNKFSSTRSPRLARIPKKPLTAALPEGQIRVQTPHNAGAFLLFDLRPRPHAPPRHARQILRFVCAHQCATPRKLLAASANAVAPVIHRGRNFSQFRSELRRLPCGRLSRLDLRIRPDVLKQLCSAPSAPTIPGFFYNLAGAAKFATTAAPAS